MLNSMMFIGEIIFDVLAIPAIFLALAIAMDCIAFSKHKITLTILLLIFATVGFASGYALDINLHNRLHFYILLGALGGLVLYDLCFLQVRKIEKYNQISHKPKL